MDKEFRKQKVSPNQTEEKTLNLNQSNLIAVIGELRARSSIPAKICRVCGPVNYRSRVKCSHVGVPRSWKLEHSSRTDEDEELERRGLELDQSRNRRLELSRVPDEDEVSG
ncbi:hypothetical protein AVEN_57823-1 [Araneus ventricosus]|uniref:Uncharacterized protein n=1 Tax=Araneus ventricosus TaxID=182803 RepID=A0A4Y2I8P3_ARAVE|nr:hypothetical protein AVEN_57823-1 [Araneus ventricosus]